MELIAAAFIGAGINYLVMVASHIWLETPTEMEKILEGLE